MANDRWPGEDLWSGTVVKAPAALTPSQPQAIIEPVVTPTLQPPINRQGFAPEAPTARPPQPRQLSLEELQTPPPQRPLVPEFIEKALVQQAAYDHVAAALRGEKLDPPPGMKPFDPAAPDPQVLLALKNLFPDDPQGIFPKASLGTKVSESLERFFRTMGRGIFEPTHALLAQGAAFAADLSGVPEFIESSRNNLELVEELQARPGDTGFAAGAGDFAGFILNPMYLGAFGLTGKLTLKVIQVLGGKFGPATLKLLVRKGGVSKETARKILAFEDWAARHAGTGAMGFGAIEGLDAVSKTETTKGVIDGIIHGVKMGIPLGLIFGTIFGSGRVLGVVITDALARRRLGLPQTGKLTADQLKTAYINKAVPASLALGGSDEAFMLVTQAFERLAVRAKLVEALRVPVQPAPFKTVPPPTKPTKLREQPPMAPEAKVPLAPKEPGLPAADVPKPLGKIDPKLTAVLESIGPEDFAPLGSPLNKLKVGDRFTVSGESTIIRGIEKTADGRLKSLDLEPGRKNVPSDLSGSTAQLLLESGKLKLPKLPLGVIGRIGPAKPPLKPTPARTAAANKVNLAALRSQAKKEGVFVTESSTPAQIEDGLRRSKEFKANSPVRRGLIDVGPVVDAVNVGLKAVAKGGKWTVDSTKSAARWIWYTQGGEVSKLAALKALIAKFGEPIRKRFPGIWRVFSNTIRRTGKGIADFFAGGPKAGTGRLSRKPASVEDVKALTDGIATAKPLRKEVVVMMAKERIERAKQITEISERLGGREGLFAALRSQQGEFARPEKTFEPMTTVSGTQLDSLLDHITFHEFGGAPQSRLHMRSVVQNMVENGYLPTDGEIQLLETLFGSEMMKAILRRKYSKTRRAIRVAADLFNTPKSLLASWDFSAVGRQGLPETLAHPLYATKAGGMMMKAFMSESYAQKVSRDMRKDIHFDPAIQDGLFLPSVFGSVDIMSREEAFLGRIIQNIPIIRAMVRPSERSFLTYLNLMRMNAYKQGVAILELKGVPRTWNGGKAGSKSDDYHQLALFINASTGRGNISLGETGAFLNGLFFSPRLMFSHFEYPVRSLVAVTQTGVRNVVVRQMVAVNIFMATIMGMLKLLNQLQPELNIRVEDKWTSSRFGKVIIGKNTSIDMLGGRARVFSLLSQVASASYTNKKGKSVSRNPLFSGTWYVAGRLAPAPQALLSLRTGERFGGQSLDVISFRPITDKTIEFPLAGLIPDLTVPITLQNIEEVTDEHDMTGLWLMAFEIGGLGVAVTPGKESVAGPRSRFGKTGATKSRSTKTRTPKKTER